MSTNHFLKQYYFFKNTLSPIIVNRFDVFSAYLRKKEKIELQLKGGLRLILSREELQHIDKVKKAFDYGISIESNGDIMHLFSYPIIDFNIKISHFNDIELLNTISIVSDCVKYGVDVSVQSEDAKNANIKECISIDPLKKIVVSQSGIKFYLDSLISGIFTETFIQGIHGKTLDNFDGIKVLDVGANFGDSSLYFAKNGGEVYAVEPVKSNFEALRRNASLNNGVDLRLYNVAIGPEGTLNMNTRSGVLDGAASGFYSIGGFTNETVKSIPVSLFLKSNGLNEIDFLKMDCKGCEKFLTERDLKLVKKYVHIEFDPNSKDEDIQYLIDLLKLSGFNLKILNHNIEAGIGKGRNFGTIYAIRDNI